MYDIGLKMCVVQNSSLKVFRSRTKRQRQMTKGDNISLLIFQDWDGLLKPPALLSSLQYSIELLSPSQDSF